MFSTKFKYFLYTGLIACFSLFVGGITIDYFEKHNQIEELKTKVKCLEKEITRINNECAHMREVDTLILNMSEYHGKNIEIMEENYRILSTITYQPTKKFKLNYSLKDNNLFFSCSSIFLSSNSASFLF